MSETNVTLEEKYGIIYVEGKRYYKFDMTERLPLLQETIPHLFRYRTIEIKESSWNRMTLKILNALDAQNPKTEEELLSLTYSWSKQSVFSKEKRTNHTKFKNLYLNTNHTATHSMMSIQVLLQAYNVDLSECNFFIKRHPSAEPKEAKEYFRKQTIYGLHYSMHLRHIEDEKIDKVIGIIVVLNKYLARVSSGFNDFFLFDDYYYFLNYKEKVINLLKMRMMSDDKRLKTAIKSLKYLGEYYNNKDFYIWLKSVSIEDSFIVTLKSEIEGLLSNLGTNFIVCDKLYSRMMLLHRSEMTKYELNDNVNRLFNLCRILFYGIYNFSKPYISRDKMSKTTNDDLVFQFARSLDRFAVSELNGYIDKMHLKRLDSYLDFMIRCSDSHVQIDFDTMISKMQLGLDSSKIKAIFKEVSFYINSFGEINSETFWGFDSLPEIGIKWNKYALIGVVRSYLDDRFTIQYNSRAYTKLTYIIKNRSL